MSNWKSASVVASVVAAVTASPLAISHDWLKKDWLKTDRTAPLSITEQQMQSSSSEAAAWHVGDGSIYDASRGAATMPSQANTTTEPVARERNSTTPIAEPNNAPRASESNAMDQAAPAMSPSGRSAVNTGRYGSTMK